MARIRTIKPEFWTSEQVMECSPIARLLFVGMLNFCDDGGNHPASPRRLKAEVFPSDDITTTEVEGLVSELIGSGLVSEYSREDKQYWHVTGWHHQKIDKPTFKYPSPNDTQPFDNNSPSPRRVVPDASPPEGEGKGKGVNHLQEARASTDSTASTSAGRVCARLRALQIQGVNPSRPDLLQLFADGVSEQEIVAVAEEEKSRGKGIAWVIAAVIGRRAAAVAQQGAAAGLPPKKPEACCYSGCNGKVAGTVSGRHWCREHRDYAMDNANFRRAAA